MHKPYLLAGILFLGLASFAQDSSWTTIKVTKDMTFSLPANQEKTDTSAVRQSKRMDLRVFRASTENTSFVLTITSKGSDINVTDAESLKLAYNGAEEGLKTSKNLSAYHTTSLDTVIDKVTARKVNFYTSPDAANKVLTGYIFLVNDTMYFLMAVKLGTDEAYKAESDKLVRSVHFTAKSIREQQFNSKIEAREYKIGYLFGKLAGFLSIIVVIVVVIVLIVRKSSKKKESEPF